MGRIMARLLRRRYPKREHEPPSAGSGTASHGRSLSRARVRSSRAPAVGRLVTTNQVFILTTLCGFGKEVLTN